MQSVIEPLYKSKDLIQFGWSPEPGVTVSSYKIYAGKVSGSLSALVTGISPKPSTNPMNLGKVSYDVTIASVRTLLSLASTDDFSNQVLYFAITYVDSTGAESSLADSTVVKVPPVGILPKLRLEDPTVNRYIFGFSDEDQRWIKLAASSSGGLITSASDFYAANVTTEYTYDGSNNVLTEKSYLSDETTAGSPAKLITYEYTGGNVTKKTITDSTV